MARSPTYHIKEQGEMLTISHRRSRYKLQARLYQKKEKHKVTFLAPTVPGAGLVLVTGNNFGHYPHLIQRHPVNSQGQYVEVGAGLGGYLLDLLSRTGHKLPAPIAIDPLDYERARDMLELLVSLETHPEVSRIARKYLKRIDLITNPNKVRLINKSLKKALQYHRDLTGIADVVVDNCGPYWYSETEFNAAGSEEQMEALERRLLREGGVLLVSKFDETRKRRHLRVPKRNK